MTQITGLSLVCCGHVTKNPKQKIQFTVCQTESSPGFSRQQTRTNLSEENWSSGLISFFWRETCEETLSTRLTMHESMWKICLWSCQPFTKNCNRSKARNRCLHHAFWIRNNVECGQQLFAFKSAAIHHELFWQTELATIKRQDKHWQWYNSSGSRITLLAPNFTWGQTETVLINHEFSQTSDHWKLRKAEELLASNWAFTLKKKKKTTGDDENICHLDTLWPKWTQLTSQNSKTQVLDVRKCHVSERRRTRSERSDHTSRLNLTRNCLSLIFTVFMQIKQNPRQHKLFILDLGFVQKVANWLTSLLSVLDMKKCRVDQNARICFRNQTSSRLGLNSQTLHLEMNKCRVDQKARIRFRNQTSSRLDCKCHVIWPKFLPKENTLFISISCLVVNLLKDSCILQFFNYRLEVWEWWSVSTISRIKSVHCISLHELANFHVAQGLLEFTVVMDSRSQNDFFRTVEVTSEARVVISEECFVFGSRFRFVVCLHATQQFIKGPSLGILWSPFELFHLVGNLCNAAVQSSKEIVQWFYLFEWEEINRHRYTVTTWRLLAMLFNACVSNSEAHAVHQICAGWFFILRQIHEMWHILSPVFCANHLVFHRYWLDDLTGQVIVKVNGHTHSRRHPKTSLKIRSDHWHSWRFQEMGVAVFWWLAWDKTFSTMPRISLQHPALHLDATMSVIWEWFDAKPSVFEKSTILAINFILDREHIDNSVFESRWALVAHMARAICKARQCTSFALTASLMTILHGFDLSSESVFGHFLKKRSPTMLFKCFHSRSQSRLSMEEPVSNLVTDQWNAHVPTPLEHLHLEDR